MCAGAILQGRVSELVWGAPNSLLGADGSWIKQAFYLYSCLLNCSLSILYYICLCVNHPVYHQTKKYQRLTSRQLSFLYQTLKIYKSIVILKVTIHWMFFRLFPMSSSSEHEPKGRDYLHPFHRTIAVRRGVLAEESDDLMQTFIAMRRMEPKCRTDDAHMGVKSSPWPRSPGWLPPAFKKLNSWVQRWFQF